MSHLKYQGLQTVWEQFHLELIGETRYQLYSRQEKIDERSVLTCNKKRRVDTNREKRSYIICREKRSVLTCREKRSDLTCREKRSTQSNSPGTAGGPKWRGSDRTGLARRATPSRTRILDSIILTACLGVMGGWIQISLDLRVFFIYCTMIDSDWPCTMIDPDCLVFNTPKKDILIKKRNWNNKFAAHFDRDSYKYFQMRTNHLYSV